MKNCARIVTAFLTILLSISVLAGLKNVPFDSGVAFAPTEVISGNISVAGGGVILRDVAICDSTTSDVCNFQSVNLVVQREKSSVRVASLKSSFLPDYGVNCVAEYKTDNWILRSAIDLVSSETDEVFRNVNLLGEPTGSDIRLLRAHNISYDKVWYVEMSPTLAQSKAGETLLKLDLLLTDLRQYSTSPRNANRITEILQRSGVMNWTWTDEFARSTYSVNCTKGSLNLYGKPGFTFLTKEKRAIDFPEMIGDLIYQMNPNLIDDSVEFAKTTAFLRHIRDNYPEDWTRLKSASHILRKTPGETPRLLMR